MVENLPADTKARIQKLDSEVHRVIRDGGRTSHHSNRPLTEGEWEEVLDYIRRYELPCILQPDAYGFALWIHEHDMLPGEIPKYLLRIENGQFPFPSAKLGFAGQEETVRKVAEITHTPRNKEILAWYGFRPLERPEYYVY